MKIEQLINKYYNNLNDNDKLVCKYILNHKNNCYKMSIDEFAKQCNLSKTMVFRFSKKISLSGFSELKALLKWEQEKNVSNDIDLLLKVTNNYHKMIEDIKNKNCDEIFYKMYRANRILVYGSGYAQAKVASELKRIFLPVLQNIFYIHGYDMTQHFNKLTTSHDFVIIISLSGESKSVIDLAENLKLRQISTLSITRMKNNALASLCEESLYINSISIPTDYMLDYEISTPYFIMIEFLFLKYQKFLEQFQL